MINKEKGSIEVKKGALIVAWWELEDLVNKAADRTTKEPAAKIKAAVKTVKKGLTIKSDLDAIFQKGTKRKGL